MTSQSECLVTFSVRSGIFGVDRLAKRLKALVATEQIGDWHIDHWVDWRHTAIRIRFGTVADASRAEVACFDAGNPPDLQP